MQSGALNNTLNLQDIKSNANITLTAAKAQKASLSLFYFVQEMWDQVVADKPKWNWHIPLLCSELMNIANRIARQEVSPYDLLVNIPPGTTKSLLFSVFFPAWCWTKWPWLQFIKTAYSATLSLEHAELCRELVASEKYQRWYPTIRIKRDKKAKSNFRIVHKNTKTGLWTMGGNLYSTSIGGTLTGFHAHINIIDDPIDPYRAYSEVELENANRFITQVLPTRVKDKERCPMIMIMQRVMEGDPSDRMLERQKKGLKVKHICLPGRLETKEDKERVKPKELQQYYIDGFLDPVRLGKNALTKLMLNLGQYGYAGQIQQDSSLPGGGMFKVGRFKVIKYEDVNWHANLEYIVRYWDKAASDDAGAYTVGVKIARLKSDRYIVLDVIRGQWSSDKRERIIKETSLIDGPNILQKIEQEPGSGGKESAQGTIRNLQNSAIPIQAERPTGNKVYRADPWSVRVNMGHVWLLEAEWNYEYVEEHRKFPMGKYKDQVDASSGAYNELFNNRRAGVWGD